ncbi:hypothetical protein I7I51_01521 [Histoplasma capsulatum]|uniref:Uncharacterized protein n=1 Tax=Ajellomyces capsulatus TaxID=5037 RepID=A0A8A1MIF8_AJECA|nr:predicted protein [Histoplasma mississippiense (nom. inval.)]EDN10350.1 predicted protein [Histoplasma mississippiense (nom. inval.)]QSS64453.1 hypothetical protein I7I51_01521 [Histoplasma capsulatum]
MNQALGLTHLPGSQQQQNRQICFEETSIPQAVHPPTSAPSSPLRTQCRQQSPDSLFDDDETFELSWESQLMDILPPEELLASYSNEQNTPGAVINTLESGSNQGAERHEAQTASGSVGDINPVPDSPAGFHHESDCRKRPFYNDNISRAWGGSRRILDNPCSEKELSANSLINGTSPIAAAAIEHIPETTTPQRPEESCKAQDVSESIQFVENYITKNFRLRKEDILATQHREIFRHVPKPEVYISPYPKYRGPLGYFPSAPATHARCIEVAPDDVAVRLEEYRRNLQKVRSERSKYRTVWAEWKTVDPTTGKSKEQMLKEEPFRLKRALLAQERKTEEFRKQAEDWRGQYNNLAIAYNGLVQHLHMLQSAQILRHPAHLPPGHPTPVPSPQPELVTVDSSINLPPDPPRAARNTPHPHPITIDLTDDEPTNHNTKDLSSVSFLAEEYSGKHAAEELRTAMCRKEYQWLGKNNRPPRRLLPAIPSLRGELPQKSTYSTSAAPSVTTQGDSATSASATSSEAMMEGRPHDSNDNIDELARALEAELERGTSISC